MSLRIRLFLLFGGLMAALVLGQWWWLQNLTRDLSAELGDVAEGMVSSTAEVFLTLDCEGEDCREPVVEAKCNGQPCDPATLDELLANREEFLEDSRQVLRDLEGDTELRVHADVRLGETVRIVQVERDVDDGLPSVVFHGDTDHDVRVHRFRVTAEGEVEKSEENIGSLGEARGMRRVLQWIGAGPRREQEGIVLAGPGFQRRIPIPRSDFDAKLERLPRSLLSASLVLLLAGLLGTALVAHRVTRPLEELAGAARQVGEGALGTQVERRSGGEVGHAIQAFNRMSRQVAELDARNRQLSAHRHLSELGEVARGLAHTLRNPLNALGLSVEELAGHGQAEQRDLAESARRQIRRLDHSIRSFLALASQGGGMVSEVSLPLLLEDVALEALQDNGGRVKIEVDAPPDLPGLRAVEPELRAVLQALVVNAVEASPEGEVVEGRVARQSGSGLRVEIEDRGSGLPESVRRRLFTPHLSTKASGSGMGLYLAHRIATTRYDGRLRLEDRDGGGTRAVLEISDRRGEVSDG